MNETLTTTGGRSVLRMERRLKHTPEKVWRALTDPEHLSAWFPARVSVEPHADAKITFDMGGEQITTGVVTDLEPGRVFAFTWETDHLRWEIRPDGEGTLLLFTHTFDDRAGAASFATGWETCLDAMDTVLADGTLHDPGKRADLHEAYIKRFGLDEGTVESTAGGWTVRFERQLTQPAEVVWEALAGSALPAPGMPPPAGFTAPAIPPREVTEVDPPRLLAYGWRAGTIRWELTAGTGHGARLIVTQSGPADETAEQAGAFRVWRERIEDLAAGVVG